MITKVYKSFMDQWKNWKITDVYYLLVIFLMVLGLQLWVIIDNPAGDPLWVNIVSSFASVFGVIAAVQMTRRNIWNFFWAFLSSIGIGVSTMYSHVYLQGALELLVLIPMYLVGSYQWARTDGYKDETVEPRDMKNFSFWSVVLGVLAVSAGLMFLVAMIPGEGSGVDSKSLSMFIIYLDTVVFALGVASEFLMISRYKQAWISWAIVNVLGCTTGLLLIINGNTAMISVFSIQLIFLFNTVKGYFTWKEQTDKKTEATKQL